MGDCVCGKVSLLPVSLRSFPSPWLSCEQVSALWLHSGFKKSGSTPSCLKKSGLMPSGLKQPAPVRLSPHSLLLGGCYGPVCSFLGHFLLLLHLCHLHRAGHWKADTRGKGKCLYLTFRRPWLCCVGNRNSKRMLGCMFSKELGSNMSHCYNYILFAQKQKATHKLACTQDWEIDFSRVVRESTKLRWKSLDTRSREELWSFLLFVFNSLP